jgi:hypothetical protein
MFQIFLRSGLERAHLMTHSSAAKITLRALLCLLLLLSPWSASLAQTDAEAEEPPVAEENADGVDAADPNGSVDLETDADIEALIALFLEDPQAFLETQTPATIQTVISAVVRRDPGVITRVLAAEARLTDDDRREAVANGVAMAVVNLSGDGRSDAAAQVIAAVSLSASPGLLGAVVRQVNVLSADRGIDAPVSVPEIIEEPAAAPPAISGVGADAADSGLDADSAQAAGTGGAPIGGLGSDLGQGAAPNPSADAGGGSADLGGSDAGLSEGTIDPDVSPVN